MASDAEVGELINSLTDKNLLENEIQFVNQVWDKVQHHRSSRKEEAAHLRQSLDNLEDF